jgi:ATP-dependent exoDNAse (exonuclease V) alpha subunit
MHSYEGIISGDFDERSYPAPHVLDLKEGAQVMLTSNDSSGRWFNGTVGVIHKTENIDGVASIFVKLENGQIVEVEPNKWKMYKFSFDRLSQKITSEISGSFTQYPLILSWAVTIHKSQGKTFNKVIVDMGTGAFAHGQTYVALSRCTTLSGFSPTRANRKETYSSRLQSCYLLNNYNFGVE